MINENLKPNYCCEMGSYKCQIPMALNGRLQSIDICIADIVASLNANNIITKASCCGHDVDKNGIITLEDGRVIMIEKLKKNFKEEDE